MGFLAYQYAMTVFGAQGVLSGQADLVCKPQVSTC
jgi:hypothetical protein